MTPEAQRAILQEERHQCRSALCEACATGVFFHRQKLGGNAGFEGRHGHMLGKPCDAADLWYREEMPDEFKAGTVAEVQMPLKGGDKELEIWAFVFVHEVLPSGIIASFSWGGKHQAFPFAMCRPVKK